MDVPSPIRPEALLAEAGLVRRLAQALVRRSDLAQDVVQEVMLVALRQPESPGHLRGWLAAVTRRLAGKAVRSQRVRERAEAAAAPEPFGDGEARTAERLQLHRRLTDAVLALPEPYRTAVTLRFFDELPPRAIAQRLGTSSDVVRKRLQRGLEMLRERLDGEFGERRAWATAFAGLGLLEAGGPWLLLSVLAMNKLVIAAAATLAVAAWMLWPEPAPPPVSAASSTAVAAAPSVAEHRTEDDLAGSPRRVIVPAGPAAAETPACNVLVVDARDRPITGADVYAWDAGSEAFARQVTDAHGRCTFEAAGPGGVLVIADGHAPHHANLVERRGEHRIAMPLGEVIEGLLTVDGQPGFGWRLRLHEVSLPESVPAKLRLHHRLNACGVACDRNGSFRFEGLREGWRGTLWLPGPLRFADDGFGWSRGVTAPQRRLDLRTTQLPNVRGRVVWSDSGEPVMWPSVMGHAEFGDGQSSPLTSVTGDRDGSFAIGFEGGSSLYRQQWLDAEQRPSFAAVTLWIEDDGSTAKTSIELDADRLASREEVVAWLDRAPVTHFHCVDADGRPIAGARVKARGISEPTGSDGRGAFAGRPEDVELVGSPLHRIGPVDPRVRAAGTSDDPLTFVLEPANTVRIRIEGRVEPEQRIQMRCGVLPFAGHRPAGELDRLLASMEWDGGGWRGKRQPDGSQTPCDYYMSPSVSADGVVTLRSLEPGVRCDVAILDGLGRDRVKVTFTAPESGAVEMVSMRAPAELSPFDGRVVDAQGRAVEGVEARLEMIDGERVVTTSTGTIVCAHDRTDAEGRFDFRDVGRLEQLVLTLRADGFVERRITSLAPGTEHVLQRGCVVEVRVVDGAGAVVDLDVVQNQGRQYGRKEMLRAGVWRFSDLVPGRETFGCTIGGNEFSIEHDTAVPEAILRVPTPARLHLVCANDWPALADVDSGMFAVASCLEGGHRSFRMDGVERGSPWLMLPGRWHLELFEWSQPDRSLPAVERSLGLTAEVTLRAGEEVTATLR